MLCFKLRVRHLFVPNRALTVTHVRSYERRRCIVRTGDLATSFYVVLYGEGTVPLLCSTRTVLHVLCCDLLMARERLCGCAAVIVAVLIQTGTIETGHTAVTLTQGESFGVRCALQPDPLPSQHNTQAIRLSSAKHSPELN